jgi:cell division septation protein DedD
MSSSEFNNTDIKNELEFNDGVGDALREKKAYVFSWKKTMAVLSIGFVGVVLFTFGVLEIGKKAFDISDNSAEKTVNDLSMDSSLTDSDVLEWQALPVVAIDVDPVLDETAGEADLLVDVSSLKASESSPSKDLAPVPVAPPSPVNVTVSDAASSYMYRVIAGSFSDYNNAVAHLRDIKQKGFDGYIWSLTSKDNRVTYKVQVGSFSGRSLAQKQVAQLKKHRVSAYISKYK